MSKARRSTVSGTLKLPSIAAGEAAFCDVLFEGGLQRARQGLGVAR